MLYFLLIINRLEGRIPPNLPHYEFIANRMSFPQCLTKFLNNDSIILLGNAGEQPRANGMRIDYSPYNARICLHLKANLSP